MEIISNTGDRLKLAMDKQNIKQSDLSKQTGIGKSAISQYLSYKVSPKQDKIFLLAKELNVSEAWLMGYDVPMERFPQFSHPDIQPIKKKTLKIANASHALNESKETLMLTFVLLLKTIV